MRTIRRLYFYAVAFISMEVVLWGVIGLLRTVLSSGIVNPADALAQALALVLVGVPIFLFHWLWAQRAAAQEEEEQSAVLRSVFFYGVLIATLVPVAQNLLAWIARSMVRFSALDNTGAVLGGYQTWQDNLIAILINGLAAGYFWDALRKSWKALPETENFSDVRRLYRYLWLLYGLLMAVFGTQQTLRYVIMQLAPEKIVGPISHAGLANGLALLFVGIPLWVFTWHICQNALETPSEGMSNLRLGVLYLLSLGGVVTVLSAGGTFLNLVLRWVFGERLLPHEFINQAGGPISLGLPLAGVWAYYGGWLQNQIESDPEESGRAAKRRIYLYSLSLIGLVATFVGVALLLSFVIDLATSNVLWGEALRTRLAGALATTLIGLPLWLSAWRPLQAEAIAVGEAGDRTRRSALRRSYLYLALFAGVIGGMVSAVWLVYTFVNALLIGEMDTDFFSSFLNAAQLLVLFSALLVYHLGCLRRDSEQTSHTLGARQREYAVLLLEAGDEAYLRSLTAALRKYAPEVPVTLQAARGKLPKKANDSKALILPVTMVLEPPEGLRKWLATYPGKKVVVGQAAPGWVLQPLTPKQAAQTIRKFAEGETVQLSQPAALWENLKNIAVIWLGIQLLFVLLGIVISLLAD